MNEEIMKRKVPVECYTRVVGFFRRVADMNPGKVQEFRDRINYKIPEDFNSGYNKQTTKQDFKETL